MLGTLATAEPVPPGGLAPTEHAQVANNANEDAEEDEEDDEPPKEAKTETGQQALATNICFNKQGNQSITKVVISWRSNQIVTQANFQVMKLRGAEANRS